MNEIVNPIIVLPPDQEAVALALLETRGDVVKASRCDTVDYNAMALRALLRDFPVIRNRYSQLLGDELLESGLHITERILKMVDLQNQAMGGPYKYICPVDDVEKEGMAIADPSMVIKLSVEISRLIAEGKASNISSATAVVLTSKEDAKELLAAFLIS